MLEKIVKNTIRKVNEQSLPDVDNPTMSSEHLSNAPTKEISNSLPTSLKKTTHFSCFIGLLQSTVKKH